jgi:hypothetical protein
LVRFAYLKSLSSLTSITQVHRKFINDLAELQSLFLLSQTSPAEQEKLLIVQYHTGQVTTRTKKTTSTYQLPKPTFFEIMMTPTFTMFLALILSLFTLAGALPTAKSPAPALAKRMAGPRSLLGRHYVRQAGANSTPHIAIANIDITRDGPSRRTDRFQAAQRRIARNPAAERIAIVDHDENLLSNQSMIAPQSGTPTQAPTSTETLAPQAHLAAPNTSVTLIPSPTPSAHTKKHPKSGEKKTGAGKVVKKTQSKA